MQRYTWKTRKIIYPAADAVTIQFDTNGQAFDYLPGQYVNVYITINGKTEQRAYSLCSSPYTGEAPAITVKRLEGGLVSNYLADHAHEIQEWEIEGPLGIFTADVARFAHEQVLLIGGGSGMTPLFSIAKSLLYRSAVKVNIIYASRLQENTLFFNELNLLEAEFPERLQVHYVFSRHDRERIADCRRYINERLNGPLLKEMIGAMMGEKLQKAAWFVCGPEGLITLAETVAGALEIPAQQLLKEYFNPAAAVQEVPLPDASNEVLLHFFERSNLLEVMPGKSILDTALEEGIPLFYSCKNGTCGRCAGKLLCGKVHMKANYALRDELLQVGYILLCQSFPLDNEVTVAVDD
jgi:Flavodoxin reductases (ferredoxin-NADPH reductases) family 1